MKNIILIVLFASTSSFLFAGSNPKASKKAVQRQELNYGYAVLYGGVKGLVLADHYLKVKQEQKSFRIFMQNMQDMARTIVDDMDRVAKDFPALDYSSNGKPKIIQDKDSRLSKDRVLSLAPLFGEHGIDFERTLLLSTAAICNQMRHMSHIIAEQEPNKALKTVVQSIEDRLNKQYSKVVKHLEQNYFIQK